LKRSECCQSGKTMKGAEGQVVLSYQRQKNGKDKTKRAWEGGRFEPT